MQCLTDSRAVLGYFRDSLADADLFELKAEQADMIPIKPEEIQSGVLKDLSRFDFKNVDWVDVVVCPVVIRRKFSHQASTQPQLYPVLIKAVINARGEIQVGLQAPVWIPRRLLEPSGEETLILGHADLADEYLAKTDLPRNWSDAINFAKAMLDHVCGLPHLEFFAQASLCIEEGGTLTASKKVRQVNKKLIEVYDSLIKRSTATGVLKHFTWTSKAQQRVVLDSQVRESIHRHLGQFKSNFELSPSQRVALGFQLHDSERDLVVVSGPPGTGKTTLIQSVIATMRVHAALKDERPPVIVGSSTNNQAIINILTSLYSEGADSGGFDRWLPGPQNEELKELGVYVPSPSKGKDSPVTEILQFEVHNPDKCSAGFIFSRKYAETAKEYFLNRCRSHFKSPIESLDEAQCRIRFQLGASHESYVEILELTSRYLHLKALSLDEENELLEQEHATCLEKHATLKRVLNAWTLTRSISFSMTYYLRFLKLIREWRRTRLENFCLQYDLPVCGANDRELMNHIGSFLQQLFKQNTDKMADLDKKIESNRALLAERDEIKERYRKWRFANLQGAEELNSSLDLLCNEIERNDVLNAWLDKNLRFEMFKWSTRFFEVGLLRRIMNRTSILTRDEEINLLAFVFPCIVTTFHAAPHLFSDGSHFLFEKIDLLIVDEAAQALTATAGPLLAFSKKALLLGDEKQLEPVRAISRTIDKSNLLQRKVIARSKDYYEKEIQAMSSSQGNLLSAAIHVSPKNESGQVPMLLEHRRCVPMIIKYCNELAYDGALRSMRNQVHDAPWPSFAYAHVEGEMKRSGGSRSNPQEAMAISEWIKRNETKILTRFNCEHLNEAIAIITPFAAQRMALGEAAKRMGFFLDKIGTVHVMQGAERPLVLFSPVYDARHTDSLRFDQGVNMLNVAVSRARDHFIVIGNMSLFDPLANTPSGRLSRFLFSDAGNELSDVEPFARGFAAGPARSIRTLEKHREALRWSFRKAQRRLVIVSPYITLRAMEEDLIFDEAAQAKARGVSIVIYFDPYLTSNTLNSVQLKVIKQRLGINAEMIPIDRTHAKLIAIDESILIKGSFNWLSASRNPQYALYEISHCYQDAEVREDIQKILEEIQRRLSPKGAGQGLSGQNMYAVGAAR